MPKHIHKIYKQPTEGKSKYMWKCTDCAWFVHAGLEYVIVGKQVYCWNCDDIFQMDERALSQIKPMCFDCSMTAVQVPIVEPVNETEEAQKERERIANMLKNLK